MIVGDEWGVKTKSKGRYGVVYLVVKDNKNDDSDE